MLGVVTNASCWDTLADTLTLGFSTSVKSSSGNTISRSTHKPKRVNHRSYSHDRIFRQIHLILFSSLADIDYSKLWGKLRQETSLVQSGSAVTHGQGTFAHITGGYDAGYYSYAYSLVFAADMYKTVFKGAPLDPAKGMFYTMERACLNDANIAIGKLYRDKILQPGASRDELDSLKVRVSWAITSWSGCVIDVTAQNRTSLDVNPTLMRSSRTFWVARRSDRAMLNEIICAILNLYVVDVLTSCCACHHCILYSNICKMN